MKVKNKIIYALLALFMVVSISSTQVMKELPKSSNIIPTKPYFVIDHTSVELYDRIPEIYLRFAEQKKLVIVDRSVGSNINDGMTCLASESWSSSLSSCRRYYTDASLTTWKTYTANDTNIPDVIKFPGKNNRINIFYLPLEYTWEEDLRRYIEYYRLNEPYFDIITYGHNYLHVADGSNIADVYFNPTYNGTNIFDIVQLEMDYPGDNIIYWTTSLARTIGTEESQSFNDQMRNFTTINRRILFDLADIESHRPDGSLCTNSQGYEIICKEYTTEISGGHLGSVSAGKIRIAKAIWVMLALLSEWNPDVLATPTPIMSTEIPTTVPTEIPTLIPPPTLMPSPTFTSTPEAICVWMNPQEYQEYLQWKNSLTPAPYPAPLTPTP